MGKPFLALSGGALTATTIAVPIAISATGNLNLIEVVFYDKDANGSSDANHTKKIRINLDYLNRTSKNAYADYYDSKGATESEKWKSINTGDDQILYQNLYTIASKYIQVQNVLNLVKKEASEEDLSKACPDPNKCCCKDKAQCKSGKCTTCLCCYADNQKSTDDCCCKTAGSTCTWTEFKKTQKTFKDLLKNSKAGELNTYLHPVQAHIKLTDASFDDLKKPSSTSGSSGGSGGGGGGSGSSSSSHKTFLGTLVYGFIDYYYKPTKYKAGLLPSGTNESYTTLATDAGKDNYFANIPQRFKFLPAGSTAASGTETNSDIDKILEKIKDKSWIRQQASNSTTSSTTAGDTNTNWWCQCDDKNNDYVSCLLKRNYVFLEKDTTPLENIQKKIKDAGDCCSDAAQ